MKWNKITSLKLAGRVGKAGKPNKVTKLVNRRYKTVRALILGELSPKIAKRILKAMERQERKERRGMRIMDQDTVNNVIRLMKKFSSDRIKKYTSPKHFSIARPKNKIIESKNVKRKKLYETPNPPAPVIVESEAIPQTVIG